MKAIRNCVAESDWIISIGLARDLIAVASARVFHAHVRAARFIDKSNHQPWRQSQIRNKNFVEEVSRNPCWKASALQMRFTIHSDAIYRRYLSPFKIGVRESDGETIGHVCKWPGQLIHLARILESRFYCSSESKARGLECDADVNQIRWMMMGMICCAATEGTGAHVINTCHARLIGNVDVDWFLLIGNSEAGKVKLSTSWHIIAGMFWRCRQILFDATWAMKFCGRRRASLRVIQIQPPITPV